MKSEFISHFCTFVAGMLTIPTIDLIIKKNFEFVTLELIIIAILICGAIVWS